MAQSNIYAVIILISILVTVCVHVIIYVIMYKKSKDIHIKEVNDLLATLKKIPKSKN